MNREERRRALEATYKSKDTEEWIDIVFTRPLGYMWALFFQKLNVHPNTVTLLSLIIGAFSGYCFYHESLGWTLSGILMLVWANLYDSADGQLARMTGKKSMWGRLLDGLAGDVWFFSIYVFISLRLTHQQMPFGLGQEWGIWIWILAIVSGVFFHKEQAGLADYYRNIYLLYLLDSSELGESGKTAAEKRATPWREWYCKIGLFFYERYTVRQERSTPCFQRMRAVLREKYGDEVPVPLRRELCRRMFPLLKWTNVLSFNIRAIVLFTTLLCGEPWLYFIFELTILNVIYFYMRGHHERICREIADSVQDEQQMA